MRGAALPDPRTSIVCPAIYASSGSSCCCAIIEQRRQYQSGRCRVLGVNVFSGVAWISAMRLWLGKVFRSDGQIDEVEH